MKFEDEKEHCNKNELNVLFQNFSITIRIILHSHTEKRVLFSLWIPCMSLLDKFCKMSFNSFKNKKIGWNLFDQMYCFWTDCTLFLPVAYNCVLTIFSIFRQQRDKYTLFWNNVILRFKFGYILYEKIYQLKLFPLDDFTTNSNTFSIDNLRGLFFHNFLLYSSGNSQFQRLIFCHKKCL